MQNSSLFQLFKSFQAILAFHIDTNHLIYCANQTTGFFIKCNTELKRFKLKMKLYTK